jgi:hypothetical protein
MFVSPSGDKIAFLGSGGYAHICSGRSKAWMTDIKMNTPIRSLSFLDDYSVVTSGLDADVYWWDMRMTAKCVLRCRLYACDVCGHLK